MSLVLLFCSYFQPDVNNLGLDSWPAREQWSARYDNLLSALLLPRTPSEDPEVRYRVEAIRVKHLKPSNFGALERATKAYRYDLWLRVFVLDGNSWAYSQYDIFIELHTSTPKADAFFKIAPVTIGDQTFLRGSLLHGEYEQFESHIQTYRKNKVK